MENNIEKTDITINKSGKKALPLGGLGGINWGTGIVIAFALFMSFILYFVFTVQQKLSN